MDLKVLKIDLNTKLQYYFLCCVFPLSTLRTFVKIFSFTDAVTFSLFILVLALIIYFICVLNARCSTFIVVNENALQVCQKHTGKVKILNEIKKDNIKSVGYMSSSILATTKDKQRIYMMNIFPPILAVLCSLNAIVIFTFLFKFILFQSQMLNKLNLLLNFDFKKRNIFIKIFDFLINAFFWFCLIVNLFLTLDFLCNFVKNFI